jgi:hypothetical protein
MSQPQPPRFNKVVGSRESARCGYAVVDLPRAAIAACRGVLKLACTECGRIVEPKPRATLEITGKCRDSATGRVSVTVALVAAGDMSPDDQVSEIVDLLHRLAADYGRE